MRKLALSAAACFLFAMPATAQAGGSKPTGGSGGHEGHGSTCEKKSSHTAMCGDNSIQIVSFVRIDLRGLGHGVYGGRIFYRVSVNGRRAVRNTQVHLFRTCYGNVRGGIAAGLNRIPYTPI
jgi:hypothetical protein